MNKEQEYIKFWASIIDKLNEIEKDYNNLSDENKHRVDSLKDTILHMHTYVDVIQILHEQIKWKALIEKHFVLRGKLWKHVQ